MREEREEQLDALRKALIAGEESGEFQPHEKDDFLEKMRKQRSSQAK